MIPLSVLEGSGDLGTHVVRMKASVLVAFVHMDTHLRGSGRMLKRLNVFLKSIGSETPEVLG